MMHRPGRLRSRGFSLLELAMALAIFATGLGAFSLLLLMSVRETASSHTQTLAVSQARSLSNQLRMLSSIGGTSNDREGNDACLSGSICPPGSMADAMLTSWRRGLSDSLPGGDGTICRDATPHDGVAGTDGCDGLGNPVVKVFWQEPGRLSEDSPEFRRVVVQAGLP